MAIITKHKKMNIGKRLLLVNRKVYIHLKLYIYTTAMTIPKIDKALDNEFKRCWNKKAFVNVDKSKYINYLDEAYSDIASAEKESSDKWAITKAYQALFIMTNALLVRHFGCYSKDHGCVIIALLRHKIVSEEVLDKISRMLSEKKKLLSETKPKSDFFREIENIRLIRNKYMYIPQTLRKLKSSPEDIIAEVKVMLNILRELL